MFRSPSISLANRVVDMEGVKYRVVEQLDDGSYSDVYKVQRLNDEMFFAIKKIRVLRGNNDAETHLRQECYAASKLGQNPHIVQLFEKSEHALRGGRDGDKEVFLLNELCPGGNLFNLIQSRTNQGVQGLPETEVLLIAWHVVQGLLHMHTRQPPIAHRDLKPENVVLGVDNRWKLCDFGSCTTTTQANINGDNRHKIQEEIRRQTTRLYQAPEQIDLFSGFPINEKVDIFALGCLLFTLLFFRSPFDPDMVLEHSNARFTVPNHPPISQGMRQMLTRTLTQDPSQRISSAELWSQLDCLQQKGQQRQQQQQQQQQVKPMPATPRAPATPQQQLPVTSWPDQVQRRSVKRSNSVSMMERDAGRQQATQNVHPYQQQNSVTPQLSRINHSQSLLTPHQPSNPQMLIHPQQNQSQSYLPFPSVLEQQEMNIRNWVNHYCEANKNAPSELAFRNLVNVLVPNVKMTRPFMIAISQMDVTMVLVALKSFCLIHRQMLYCPKVDPRPYVKLFNREYNRWVEIERLGQGHVGDFYRTPLLTKLVYQYIDVLRDKVSLVSEYGHILNSAYVLQKQTIGVNNSTTNSPIATQFLVKLTQLFDKFRFLHGSLFNERNQLFEIRLTIAINLIEDQFLLMSLLIHLNFTFKVMYKLKQGGSAAASQNLDKVVDIITQFDNVFKRCLESYQQLVADIRKINDVQHIRAALPTIPPSSLTETLMQEAETEARRLWQSPNAFQRLLGVHNARAGFFLPVFFELYPNYLTNCNYEHEVIIGNPLYRAALNQKLPENYFDNPSTITAVSSHGIPSKNSMTASSQPPSQTSINIPQQVQQRQPSQPQMPYLSSQQQQSQPQTGFMQVPQQQYPPVMVASMMPVQPMQQALNPYLNQPMMQQPQAKQQAMAPSSADLLSIMDNAKTQEQQQQEILAITYTEPITPVKPTEESLSSTIPPVVQTEGKLLSLSSYRTGSANDPQKKKAAELIKKLKQRNAVVGASPDTQALTDKIPKRTSITDTNRKVIRLKKSPNARIRKPPIISSGRRDQKGNDQQVGDLLDLGLQQEELEPESEQNQLEKVFAIPEVNQTERVVKMSETLLTAKPQNLAKPGLNAEQDQDVSEPEHLPSNMYTIPASESNYQYDGTQNSSMLKQMTAGIDGLALEKSLSVVDKYQGNPLQDLMDDQEEAIVMNKDMDGFFEQQLPKNQPAQDDQDGVSSAEELKSQMDLILIKEREIEAHRAEELRQSMTLDKLKLEKKSKLEIEAKQHEIDQIQSQLKHRSHALVTMQSQLSEMQKKEEEFNQVKLKARDYMMQQQRENQQLRELNDQLKREKEELQQTQQSERSVTNMTAVSMAAAAAAQQQQQQQLQQPQAAKTQTQQASDILSEQFQKAQDYFRINLDDIRFEKQIGAGASADVFKAIYKENDVAVKKLKFLNAGQDTSKNNLTKEFKREISTLIKVRHTNLVNFMGACTDDQRGHVLILTEFCFGGTLFSLLHEKRSVDLTMRQRFRMAIDIAKGMNFLHIQEPQILHRDLKSLNLLLVEPVLHNTDYVQVKVTDFGLSRSIQEMNSMAPGIGDEPQMTGLAGTFHWMAPEILTSSNDYSFKADVYSYGIVMWEIMAREPPFKNLRPHEIMASVINQQVRPDLSKIPQDCPLQYRTIMERCWHQQPDERPDFGIILKMMKQIEHLFS